MAGQDLDDDEETPSSERWYDRTPAVVGASVVGLAVIGILIAAVTFVSRQFNEPEQAPLNFVEPSFSASATTSTGRRPPRRPRRTRRAALTRQPEPRGPSRTLRQATTSQRRRRAAGRARM
jgi:hypothetical protein